MGIMAYSMSTHTAIGLVRQLTGRWAAVSRLHHHGLCVHLPPVPMMTGMRSKDPAVRLQAYRDHITPSICSILEHTIAHNKHVITTVQPLLDTPSTLLNVAACEEAARAVGHSLGMASIASELYHLCKGTVQLRRHNSVAVPMERVAAFEASFLAIGDMQRPVSMLLQHHAPHLSLVSRDVMGNARQEAEGDAVVNVAAEGCVRALTIPEDDPDALRSAMELISWQDLRTAGLTKVQHTVDRVRELLLMMMTRVDTRMLLIEVCPRKNLWGLFHNQGITQALLVRRAGVAPELAASVCKVFLDDDGSDNMLVLQHMQTLARLQGQAGAETLEERLVASALVRNATCPMCLKKMTGDKLVFLDCVMPTREPERVQLHVVCLDCWNPEIRTCPLCQRRPAVGYTGARLFARAVVAETLSAALTLHSVLTE